MRLADTRFSTLDGAVVASLSGEIDASNAGDLGEAIRGAVSNESVGIVLELGGVDYFDSAGIHLLFRVAEDIRARGLRLAVVIPASSPVLDALRLAGARQSFRIAETVDQGLRELRR